MADMTDEPTGSTFTNKEMWVRVDAKLDTLVARQQHFDVELALLKERQHQQESALAAHDTREAIERERIAQNLKEQEELMASEIVNIKQGQLNVARLVKYAAAVIIAAGVVADAVVRFLK